MGVQDVVARLNNAKEKHSNSNPIKNNSSSTSDIMSAIKKLEQKKKAMPPTPAPALVLAPIPIPIQKKAQEQKQQQQQQQQQHPQVLQQRKQNTPIVKNINKKVTTAAAINSDMLRFDRIAAELLEIYTSLIQENETNEEKINKLQAQVEKYSSDATKVRDYEIRVEYLAQKLEQISEERDSLEKELRQLRNKPGVTSPLSPAFTQVFPSNPVLTEEEGNIKDNDQDNKNEEFMADILNVYEEIEDDDMDDIDNIDDDNRIYNENNSQRHQIEKADSYAYSQQLVEYDKGVQITISKYISQSETQRLEIKRLKNIVEKQDTLIKRLETRMTTEPDQLLKEQVEVQKIELDNKRKLLSQLLNEREELKRKIADNNRPYIPLNQERASIDILLDITNSIDFKRPNSYMSVDSSSTYSTTGRGSPPLTNPPKHPLPPLPLKQKTSFTSEIDSGLR